MRIIGCFCRVKLNRILGTAVLGLLAGACGSGDDSNEGSPTRGPEPTAKADCTGAFARLEAPYIANNTITGMGAFVADEHGLVFSAFADPSVEGSESYPQTLMASDLDGKLTTLYSEDLGMISGLVMDEENVYFTVNRILSGALIKVPRAGGAHTVLVDSDVRSAPMTDGKRLYYEGIMDNYDPAIYALDKTGGTPTLITDRGDKYLSASTMEGETLYVLDSDAYDSKTDSSLYRIPLATGKSELMASVPNDAEGTLDAVDGVIYSSLIAADFDIEFYRIEAGKAVELVEDGGSLPLVFADGFAYYPSRTGGITKNTLAFDEPTTVPRTSGRQVYALGLSPTELFFADRGCIFRTSK